MYSKIACDRIISRTNCCIPAKLRSCMYLAEPMNWLDFGVTRSKVTGLFMYPRIACDCIIMRTNRQITIKLKSCMYLAEPIN